MREPGMLRLGFNKLYLIAFKQIQMSNLTSNMRFNGDMKVQNGNVVLPPVNWIPFWTYLSCFLADENRGEWLEVEKLMFELASNFNQVECRVMLFGYFRTVECECLEGTILHNNFHETIRKHQKYRQVMQIAGHFSTFPSFKIAWPLTIPRTF